MSTEDDYATLWSSLVRGLLYPVQFEDDLLAGVDRVVDLTLKHHVEACPLNEQVELITAALASDEKLSEVLPNDHSEDAVRAFLAEVKRRFEELNEAQPRQLVTKNGAFKNGAPKNRG